MASFFAACALGLATSSAYAQTGSSPQTSSPSTGPSTGPSTEAEAKPAEASKSSEGKGISVVVTALRGAPQDPLDVPQAITSVSSSEISGQEYADVEDVIRRIPGIGLAPGEGNPNYWQEGFTIRGLGAQRVLTLTDGIRQAGQGIGYGGGNLSLYDTLSIQNIEILRGPASVLYGTDAFGGVVNVVTREPTRRSTWGVNGAVRYGYDGQFDRNRAGGYLDFGDESFAAVLGGTYTRAGEPRLPDDEDPNSGSYRQVGLFGKADFFLTEKTTLRLIGNNTRNSDILVLRDTITLPIATFPPPGSAIPIRSPLYFSIPLYQRSMAGTEITVADVSDSWEQFKTGIYWQQIRREFYREAASYPQFSPGFAGPPFFFNPSATVLAERTKTDDKVNVYESQTQSRFRFGDHLLTVGVDLGYDTSKLPEISQTQVIGQAGVGPVVRPPSTVERVRADASQFRSGVYAQNNWSLDQWEIVPGARFDYFTVDEDQNNFDDKVAGVSGSLGTVYRPTDEHSLYLTLASGFRAPDLGERFQDGIVNLGVPSRVIGNPELDPERSYSAELGTKYEDRTYRAELAGYYTEIRDYIGRRGIGIQQGFATETYDNLGEVALYGVEFASQARVLDDFELYANVARTWTDESDKIDVPGWVFNYGVLYNRELGDDTFERLRTGFNFRTVGRSIDNTVTPGREQFPNQADFTVVDFVLNLYLTEQSFGKASLVSGVKNLFDRKYREPFFDIVQPGRNAYIALQVDF